MLGGVEAKKAKNREWGVASFKERFVKKNKEKTRIKKKSHFPIMSFSRNIELGSVNGWAPQGSGGGWPQKMAELKGLLFDAGGGR